MKKIKINISFIEYKALYKLLNMLKTNILKDDKSKGLAWLAYIECIYNVKYYMHTYMLQIKKKNTLELSYTNMNILVQLIDWAIDDSDRTSNFSQSERELLQNVKTEIIKKALN